MTINAQRVTRELVDQWPSLRGAEIPEGFAILVLEVTANSHEEGVAVAARRLAAALERLAPDAARGVLLVRNEVDLSSRLNAALYQNRGIWQFFDEDLVRIDGERHQWRINHGMERYELFGEIAFASKDLSTALQVTQNIDGCVVGIPSGRASRFPWGGENMPDGLFVGAATQIANLEFVARSFGRFGDPSGVDLIAKREHVDCLVDELARG